MSQGGIADLPLYVALTTLPSRIHHLRPTLESLRAQSRVPDKVMLCLPRWSLREARQYERPEWLSSYAPMHEVVECEEDWGPGTKLLGCLDRLTRPTCLVLVDDDMSYKPFFLENLWKSQIEDRRSSFSYWTYPAGPFVVGQGADGFSFFSPNLDGLQAFARKALQCSHLRLVDDLWISVFLKTRGVAVRSIRHLIPGNGTAYERTHSLNQLADLKGNLEREAVMTAGIRYLLEAGLLGRREQAIALLKRRLRKVRDSIFGQ